MFKKSNLDAVNFYNRNYMKSMPVACFLGIIAYGVTASAEVGAPGIYCKSPVHDFGAVTSTSQVTHSFLLENKGAGPLLIEKVRACCGAEVQLKANRIEPGAAASLDIRLDLQGRDGKVQKSLFVVSNDPAEPYYQLMLTGLVPATRCLQAGPVSVTPPSVEFGQLGPDTHVEKSVELCAMSNMSFHLTGIVCTSACLRVEPKVVTNGLYYTLTVRTVQPMEKGQLSAQVSILTDNKNFPRIDIPVHASVLGDLVVVPGEMVLKGGKGSLTPVTRYLAIRSRSGRAFKILGIAVPEAGVQATAMPVEPNGFRCEIKNLMPFPELDGAKIVLTTDNKDAEQIVIPIRVEL